LLLYYNNLFPKWDKDIKLEIWNLYEGKIYSITINEKLKNYMLNEYLCDTFQIKMKNKIFIYDLETTGLDITCDIIERHFIDFDDNRVVSTGLINPHRLLDPVIIELTGIKNEDFDNSDDNLDKFKGEIKRLHQLCEDPIFIAHNGDRFDHLILQYRKILDTSRCRLLDSREIISICRQETNLYNKKLSETYEIIMGFKKENIHRAKEDTDMIIEIFKKSGITPKTIHSFIKRKQ
jgi:DNA polymerase III epsilon subunit-like protein